MILDVGRRIWHWQKRSGAPEHKKRAQPVGAGLPANLHRLHQKSSPASRLPRIEEWTGQRSDGNPSCNAAVKECT